MENVLGPYIFSHKDQLSIHIKDLPYEAMNYQGDPKLPLALGKAWGPDGK
jgi:hypothetical protein